MIVNNNVQNTECLGDIDQNSVTIDPKNINHIIQILSSNLYSNPKRSFLREIVSNAYDSHVEAGSNEPIIVTIEDNFIAIRDFGTGISPERFKSIYLCIGSSTKRESNEYLGYFGIGRFSALACSNIVNVTNFYEGKKYCYVMIKDNSSLRIDSLGTFDTTEKNGVEVKIPISDPSTYLKEIDVLNFFPNVYINSKYGKNFNERKIYTYKSFKYSSFAGNSKFSILVGNVTYNLDMSFFHSDYREVLERVSIISEIGKIDITPNREQVIYTKRTIEYIQGLLNKFMKEIKDAIDEQNNTDYQSVFEMQDDTYRCNTVTLGEEKISIYGSHREKYKYKGEIFSVQDVYNVFGLTFKDVKLFHNRQHRAYITSVKCLIKYDKCFRMPASTPQNSKNLKEFVNEYYGDYIIFRNLSLSSLKTMVKTEAQVNMYLAKELLKEILEKVPEKDLYNSKEFQDFKIEKAKERAKEKNSSVTQPMQLEVICYNGKYTYRYSTTIGNNERLNELVRNKKVLWFYKRCDEKNEIEGYISLKANKNIIALGVTKTSLSTFNIPDSWTPYDEYILKDYQFWKIASLNHLLQDFTGYHPSISFVKYLRENDKKVIEEFLRWTNKYSSFYKCPLMRKRIINSRGVNKEIKSLIDSMGKLDEKVIKASEITSLGGINPITAYMCMKKKYFNINYETYKKIRNL